MYDYLATQRFLWRFFFRLRLSSTFNAPCGILETVKNTSFLIMTVPYGKLTWLWKDPPCY